MQHNPTTDKPTALPPKRKRRRNTILAWLTGLTLVVVIAGTTLVAALFSSALRPERPVGFQVVRAVDAQGKPFALGIWYPTSAPPAFRWSGQFFMYVASNGPVVGTNLPLIAISHGTGGGINSHADLALALAAAGNVVAAPMHLDNFQDMSSVGSPAYITGRTRHLRATIDHMLTQWTGRQQIDRARIGAYGFSIGGFTVLTAAGATPDLAGVAHYCDNNTEFACDMLRQSKSFLLEAQLPPGADQFEQDSRIKAIVVAAPGLGFTFKDASTLHKVKIPVQLWQGEKDDSVPYASNARYVQEGLGHQVDFQTLRNASHYSFLVPCGPIKITPVCADPEQFDRAAAHRNMNQRVVAFFADKLNKQ